MSDTNAFIALHTINRKLRDSVSKEVADNYDKLIARIESLQQQNQKLTAALELARGLNKRLKKEIDICSYDFGAVKMGTSINRTISTMDHAEQTEQEIKKILGESE